MKKRTPCACAPARLRKNHLSGVLLSVNTSQAKGMRKHPVGRATVTQGHGIDGDAHAGDTTRQVSLLAAESIAKMRNKGLDLGPGDFAENITTRGIDLAALKVGSRLEIGDVLLEISQIGKVCHNRCAIYYQAGDCVMPREGVFAKVIEDGEIKVGDNIYVAN